jgi:hypothetical protein
MPKASNTLRIELIGVAGDNDCLPLTISLHFSFKLNGTFIAGIADSELFYPLITLLFHLKQYHHP